MNWIQIKANISPQQATHFEEALLGAGASAVTLEDAKDQPVLEPERGTTPLWDDTVITGLFSSEDDLDEAQNILKAVYQSLTTDELPQYQIEILENEDWTRKWIDNFKPLKFGERLWICPSWHDTPEPDAVNLMLDPGLAFGTGTHPTTSLCLKWLDSEASQTKGLNQKTVIDYGCGSGILGIAAHLLGAKEVIGVDNDPQALIATRDNAERNQIPDGVIKVYLPDENPDSQADILLANILAQPLYELRDNIATLLKPKGKLILSGILDHQGENLKKHYETLFEMDPPCIEEGWVRLTGTKKDR